MEDSVRGGSAEREIRGERKGERERQREGGREREKGSKHMCSPHQRILPLLAVAVCAESADSGSSKISGCSSSVVGSSSVGVASSEDGVSYSTIKIQ